MEINLPLTRKTRLSSAAAAFAVVCALAVPGPAAGVSPATTIAPSHTITLRAGVTLSRYDLPGPVKVMVITDTLDSSKAATVDTAAAGTGIHGGAATGTIAMNNGAFAAVNGDFGAFIKRPQHALLRDGELWQSGLQVNYGFALTAASPYSSNTPTAYIGKPSLRIQILTSSITVGVDHWNSGQPTGADQVVGFTSRGGTTEAPRTIDCKVHLTRSGSGSTWATGLDGLRVPYTVDTARVCGTSMAAGSGGVVLSALAGGSGDVSLQGLARNSTVTLKWSFGWPGILDASGGRPVLVQDGVSAGDGPGGTFVCAPTNPICDPQPRTVVAVTQPCVLGQAGCKVMLIVVDGRKPDWSTGQSFDDLAAFLIDDLGAYAALNLDGGGSSTMWVKKEPAAGRTPWWCQTLLAAGGCLVNRPDTTIVQRPVPTALILRPRADTNDPAPTGP